MDRLTLAVVSRNYFNMPAWIAQHAGLFAAEGLEVKIDHIEGIEEVDARVRDGRAQLAYGVTEHVILDAETGGRQAIIGGNVNKVDSGGRRNTEAEGGCDGWSTAFGPSFACEVSLAGPPGGSPA